MKRFFAEASLLLAAAIVLAVLSNAFASHERKLDWFGKPPSAAPERTRRSPPAPSLPAAAVPAGIAPHPDRPWIEIPPEQAKALFDTGVVFIDARRSAAYREGHVRGARSIPVWESDADERVAAFVGEGHDPKAPIVVYCSGGDCEDSHELAQKLWGVTFDNVSVYKDGFPDWEKRGWPVARGSAP